MTFCQKPSKRQKKAGGKACTPSKNLRDAGAHWHECIRFVSAALRSGHIFLLAGLHLQNEETSVGSGEERGLPPIQPERPVQREVAVIDTLRRIFLDGFCQRVHQTPAGRFGKLLVRG